MFPCGSVSLYGGWNGYILVSFDETSPGLAFNSQPSSFCKWTFKDEQLLQCQKVSSIIEKIDELIQDHPELEDCILHNRGDKNYAWFNVYCVPGYGEYFKKNEQV